MPDYGDLDESSGSPQRRTDNSRVRTDDRSDSKYKHHHDGGRDSSSRKEKEREKGRDRDRGSRERDQYMVKYQDSERDRKRDHYQDRSKRCERERDDSYSRREINSSEIREHRNRAHFRKNSSNDRSRSRSYSPERVSHHQSSSRSRSLAKGKRVSGFDLGPPTSSVHGGTTVAGQVLSSASAVSGVFPNIFPWASGQATRHARRVYVGGLSPYANEQSVAVFFSHVMAVIGANVAGPGDAVVNVYINHERKFAFVEMRSVEEASNAMALDGVIFDGASVKVRRPSDYNPALAASLGPSQPSPNLNLAAVGLTPGSTGGLQGPDQIFVGGIPYFFTEAQVRQLLETFGVLRGFDLVKDRETGNSKGYAFCVYEDLSVTDVACATLNGIKLGDKTLTVRRPHQLVTQPKPENENMLLYLQQQQALQKLELQPGIIPTKVLCLKHVVTIDELKDDEAYEDIMKDMTTECEKFGTLVNVVIPRPSPNGDLSPGVGKVFLEYASTDIASKAQQGLHGRKFGGNEVVGNFYPENKFAQGDYND